MKICKECKKKVADNAKVCPKCGFDFDYKKRGDIPLILGIILFFIGFAFWPLAIIGVFLILYALYQHFSSRK